MGLEQFIERWTDPEYPPEPVSEESLRAVEMRFGFTFPGDYRRELLRWGRVSPTCDLLDAICDHELDLPDLSSLKDPDSMIARTEAWREMKDDPNDRPELFRVDRRILRDSAGLGG